MNLHRLDLVSLSLFTLVVRTGSISKGAELAHLAVGATSKRISDLEAAVNAKVLYRHSRGVTLTADSRTVIDPNWNYGDASRTTAFQRKRSVMFAACATGIGPQAALGE